MKLSIKNKKDGNCYYYIENTTRIRNKVVSSTVESIGSHKKLLESGIADPLAYAQERLRVLNEEANKNKDIKEITSSVDFTSKLAASDNIVSKSLQKNVGYFYLEYIYNSLNIKDFFKIHQSAHHYDLNMVNKFLTIDRILYPRSKKATCDHLDIFYENPEFKDYHVYRFMDYLYKHYDDYIKYLFEKSNKLIKRNTSVCYYDCTNFYFEIEEPDNDYVDPITGVYCTGLRKYGYSKQHQPLPLVQMGLFMDGDGIPLTMCINPGNQNEQLSVTDVETKMMRMFKNQKFIYCADAGLNSYNIKNFNSMGSRAYIVTQSIKKLGEEYKKIVLDDTGYKRLSNNAPLSVSDMLNFTIKEKDNINPLYNDHVYKIFDVEFELDTGLVTQKKYNNGKTKIIKQKGKLTSTVIVTFSRKAYEYQRNIRKRQIERAVKVLQNCIDPEEIKKGNNDFRRFISREKLTDKKNDTEEIPNTETNDTAVNNTTTTDKTKNKKKSKKKSKNIEKKDSVTYEKILTEENGYPVVKIVYTDEETKETQEETYKIDISKIEEESKFDGYYAVATNITDAYKTYKEILEINSNRYQIEDCFRIMKTNFKSRPAYHQLPNRLVTHFMICYTSLLIYRILEKLLSQKNHHFSILQIIETLKNINVSENKDYFSSTYTRSSVLDALEDIIGLGLTYNYYKPTTLNKMTRASVYKVKEKNSTEKS